MSRTTVQATCVKNMANEKEISRKISFDNNAYNILFGSGDQRLRLLAKELDICLNVRGAEVHIRGLGERVDVATDLLEQLYALVRGGQVLDDGELRRAARAVLAGPTDLASVFSVPILSTKVGLVRPKSVAQKSYVDAMKSDDLVFGVGPAGTGKTYLAVAMAVSALLNQQVRRVILARPAVEAGERLGFLPGDLVEKVNPYVRPLYDALHDMLDGERVQIMIERGQIEVAPLAFMRGRTLNGAFVILDEAQNTTPDQMLMFLTRLGHDSKAVVTGDVSQTDLQPMATSGLADALQRLKNVRGIAIQEFSKRDVVRHPLVRRIIQAYER